MARSEAQDRPPRLSRKTAHHEPEVRGVGRKLTKGRVHGYPVAQIDLGPGVSVVVRQTLVQMLTPDEKRGRVSAVNNLFIGTSNELGETESGSVAHLFGPAMGNTIATGAMISVVSGGVGTILVVITVALIWPEIRKYGRLDGTGGS